MASFQGLRPTLALVCALTLALAGCAGSPSEAGANPTADFDEMGTLRGKVVSEEIFPVIGAILTVEEVQIAVTDASGGFELAGLPPGTVTVRIDALGYEPRNETFEVAAGEITEVSITLIGLPGQTPYVSTLIFTGYIGCGWAIVFGAGWYDFTPCAFGENADTFKVEVGPDWRAGIHEMEWETAEEMLLASSLVGTCANNGAAGVDPCPGLVSGKSPLKLVARPEDAEYAKTHSIDGKAMWPAGNHSSYLLTAYTGHYRSELNETAYPGCSNVNTATGSPPEWGCPFGAGATTGLRSQLYHTTFYLQEPPNLEDYSAIPDQ